MKHKYYFLLTADGRLNLRNFQYDICIDVFPVTNAETYILDYDCGKQKIEKTPYSPNWLDMRYLKAGNCIGAILWFQQ